MRRIVALFIFSTFLFFLLMGTGFGTSYKTNNYTLENSQSIKPQQLEHFMSYDELTTRLQRISDEYNKITELHSDRGRTHEGRTVWMMKISDNPGIQETDETEVLFVGAHHGNELIGNEVAMYIIETLTEGYGGDPRITWLVDTHEIWVVPMLNPDGTEYTLNVDSWRKNRSPNYISEVTPGPFDPKVYPTSYGTDLNRNYDYEWGDPEGSSVYLQRSSTYAGSEPFSELETQAMRNLILAHNFSAYMDYHSGTELILYPWGYTPDPTPDDVIFQRIGEVFTELTGFDTIQGYELYQTNGDAIDWIYSVTRTIAFTVELSDEFAPDENKVELIKDSQIKLPLYLTGISSNMEAGSQIRIEHENIGNQSDLG
ncbi:M14 family metallopeptidase, partial [[Eubacterium] cellulosolvens]